MSTSIDLIPVKPTTAIVGEDGTPSRTRKQSGPSFWLRLLSNDRVALAAAGVLGIVVLLLLLLLPVVVSDDCRQLCQL